MTFLVIQFQITDFKCQKAGFGSWPCIRSCCKIYTTAAAVRERLGRIYVSRFRIFFQLLVSRWSEVYRRLEAWLLKFLYRNAPIRVLPYQNKIFVRSPINNVWQNQKSFKLYVLWMPKISRQSHDTVVVAVLGKTTYRSISV